MRFNCDQQTLSKALNTVSKAISQRTTIPVLKGIMFTATGDGKLKLTATNLDLTIEKIINADVEEEGSIVVSDSRFFIELIRKLPKGIITINVMEGSKIGIKTLNTYVETVGQSPDEFPNIADFDNISSKLSFDKEILKEMIRKTQFCASLDESKGIMVGILLEMGRESFNMVAIDGYRMAIAREEMTSEREENLVINARILNEVYKILQENEEDNDVSVVLGDKKAVMILEGTKILMRLLDGEFIKYKDILPKDRKTVVNINRTDMIDSIERASLLTKEKKKNLVVIKIKENLMNISSVSEEGSVKEDIIMNKQGDDLEIHLNAKYLTDALKAIDDENVIFEFNDSLKPCMIKPVEGNSYEQLIMPARIS